ncbi:MAG: hypothetical protein LQ351_000448 [Letrouitia transgressa]|nr:MAG: hypothetical protein LQ351_000448 [Letrouitia transgressa]
MGKVEKLILREAWLSNLPGRGPKPGPSKTLVDAPIKPTGSSGREKVISKAEQIPKRNKGRASQLVPASLKSKSTISNQLENPFEFRRGRRFLKDPSLSYPLPVDLTELHRQSISTLTLIQVFGYPDVSFTGLDIVELAPDLTQYGIDWHFVQHDLRRLPLPFEDQEFDFIFVKDTVLCAKGIGLEVNPLSGLKQYLKPGGTIEVWESDLVFRCLLPYSSTTPNPVETENEQARETATYTISPETSFAKAQNRFLRDYDVWAEKALDRLGITAAPCALMGLAFSSELETYDRVGSRRIAIPFGEIRWERDGVGIRQNRRKSNANAISTAPPGLTPSQISIRQGILNAVIGLIEGLEPLLMKESGKQQDEWNRWWAGFNADLLERDGAINGECLEAGAWWARRRQ